MIYKQTIEKFQKELSSKSPTPGGGVIAALTGSFAASLIEMVCNLTLGKKGYENVQKSVIKVHKDSIELKVRLSKLAQEDKHAYEKVVEAYKTDKENPKRKELIKKSLRYAIEVPMEVRKLCQEIEVLAYKIAKVGNKNARSDAKTALYMAHAASKSALENIKINKSSLKKLV